MTVRTRTRAIAGLPVQNRGRLSVRNARLSVKTVTTLCKNREGSLSEPRGSSVGAAGRLSVRSEGGSL